MIDILFTHSYFLKLDPKQWAIGQPYAPLGTLYAAALMRENGYNVSLFDTMFATGPVDIQPALEKKPKYLVIYDDGTIPDLSALAKLRSVQGPLVIYGNDNASLTNLAGLENLQVWHYIIPLGLPREAHDLKTIQQT